MFQKKSVKTKSYEFENPKAILNVDLYLNMSIMNILSVVRSSIEAGKNVTDVIELFGLEVRNLEIIAKAKKTITESDLEIIKNKIEIYNQKLKKENLPLNDSTAKYERYLIRLEAILNKIFSSTPKELSVSMSTQLLEAEEEGILVLEEEDDKYNPQSDKI